MAVNASIPSSKKMKADHDQTEITATLAKFPDDVMENIISFFPIKKAVSSGLISKRFLNSWKLSRDLSFDFASPAGCSNIFSIIQHVMDEHSGPVIERLRVALDPSGKENLVFDWIRKAIAKGVQELDLKFSSSELPFVLTPDLLDGARLHVFKVCYCDLCFLNQFEGLRYLKTIAFENVRISHAFSEAIFSNCLFLENFEINRCVSSENDLVIEGGQVKNFKCLKVLCFHDLLKMYIDAPSLQVFHYSGDICHIILESEMSKMVESVLHINPSRNVNQFPGVENLMITLRFAKRLSISSSLVEWLSDRFLNFAKVEFQCCLWNLSEIRLRLGGTNGSTLQPTYMNPYDIARFLNNCPCIEKLTIDFGVFPMESGCYWKFYSKHKLETCTANYNFLNSILFKNFKFCDLELQLAKFIITNSKLLEHFIVVKANKYQGEEEDEMNVRRWLAAKKLKTTIYELDEYTSTL